MPQKSLPNEEVKLPKPETELPKPETDLPLPEKDLPKPISEESKQIQVSEGVLPTPTAPFQPSYMWLKLLALTLVLILIFISGFMLLQNNSTKTLPPSPTPTKTVDETANWKTLIGSGFAIKYPSTWHAYPMKNYPYEGYPGVIDQNETIITSLSKFPKFSAGNGSGDTYIGISITNTTDAITKGNLEEININGVKAYKEIQADGDLIWKIPNENGKGGITIIMLSNSKQDIPTVESILSTFKFTDQILQTDETANWKTYNGNGFSFKYPFGWAENGATINLPPDASCPQCAPGPGSLFIKIYDNPNSLSLSTYIKTHSNSFGGDYYIKDFSSYSIPGVKEAMLDPKALGAYEVQKEAIINSGKTIVSISCTGGACTNANAFEQILSTFKFTQ